MRPIWNPECSLLLSWSIAHLYLASDTAWPLEKLEAANLPKQIITRLWQPNANVFTWKRSGTREHKREEYSTVYLYVGWQEIKATKLRNPTFQSSLTCSYLTQGPEGKKQFQHGDSMERLQEDYLESYKNAMLWNVILYSNTSMIGMVSFYLTVYFYKEVWATFGFTSYESMKGFRTHAEFPRHRCGLGGIIFF